MKYIYFILRKKTKFIYYVVVSLIILSLVFWSYLFFQRYRDEYNKFIFSNGIHENNISEISKNKTSIDIKDQKGHHDENLNSSKEIDSKGIDSEIEVNNNEKVIEEIERIITNGNINDQEDENSILLLKELSNKYNNETIENEKTLGKWLQELILDPLQPKEFIKLRKREELHTQLWGSIFGKNNTIMNAEELIKYKQKLIEESAFLSQDHINNSNLPLNKKLFAMIHRSLYPWLYGHHYNSLGDIIKSSNGKGIVICVGNKYIRYASSIIDSLRYVIETKLPIEIMYYGKDDLHQHYINFFRRLKDIYITDLSTFFDNDIVGIKGWAIKPFAVLASRFEEVILIDADSFYLRDPIELYDEKGYQEKGTLFFKDRTLHPGSHIGIKWLKSWMIDPLPETRELRFWKEASRHEVESSTVVIHKTKTLLGLLNVCKLNEKMIRKSIMYRMVHGDKETFWIGFDMARQSYHLNPLPVAFVGDLVEFDEENNGQSSWNICGHNGHLLEKNKLFFWNGSLVKTKMEVILEEDIIRFRGYAMEGKDNTWSDDLFCMTLKDDQEITPLSNEEMEIYEEIVERGELLSIIIPP
jgi:hypothetical protein